MDNSGSAARHTWLERARDYCAQHLRDTAALDVPANVRISIGFAFGSRKAIGQCWDAAASADAYREVVISPTIADPVTIMGTVLHELIHAALPAKTGHKGPFKRAAVAAGLTGKMTATVCGDALRAQFTTWLTANPYTAGALDTSLIARKKQSTRLVKCECTTCGYVARTTTKWINEIGAPHCPLHGPMSVDGSTDEGDSDGE